MEDSATFIMWMQDRWFYVILFSMVLPLIGLVADLLKTPTNWWRRVSMYSHYGVKVECALLFAFCLYVMWVIYLLE